MHPDLTIIGGGLAGSEAAWQAASAGLRVRLYEMRPVKMTPAHSTGALGELVCSNSLGAKAITTASGLLKEELRRLNSLIIQCADQHQVPAGGALAVDREKFASCITEVISGISNIEVIRTEVVHIQQDGPVIVASGPLTSEGLARSIEAFTGEKALSFFDAAAPIVTLESIDQSKVFRSARYGKGGDDYLNCPMTEEEYSVFWEALITAEQHPLHDFEDVRFFEGCLPVEEIGRRGYKTLAFGPLKPVGLVDPRTGQRPFAVVQLRQDNAEGTLFNIVGFQTNLRWSEQERVFRLIPGLERAEFVRYGVMHRNTFIKSPVILKPTMQARKRDDLFFAGQITGVEGYMESTATGLLAGINAGRLVKGDEPVVPPPETALGALCRYITTARADSFQPMNINFGLFPSLPNKIRTRKERIEAIVHRSLNHLETMMKIKNLSLAKKIFL